jgi:hypothetical protein
MHPHHNVNRNNGNARRTTRNGRSCQEKKGSDSYGCDVTVRQRWRSQLVDGCTGRTDSDRTHDKEART